MLNSPLFPTPFELTDSLFDLTAEQLNILPELDNFSSTFDTIFETEFGQDLAALQSQWDAGDMSQIPELELINQIMLDRSDDQVFPGFVQEQSLADQDVANTSIENDSANMAIADQAITAQPATAAGLTFNLSFDDPAGKYTPYYAAIKSHIVAAGLSWNKYIQGKGSLEIAVKFSASDAVATGRSLAPSLIRNNGSLGIYEQGPITELRTGIDPNGATPDIEFNINPNDLTNVLWFDPNPSTRTTPVPTNKIDALSLFLHEFGHAIVFNGWKNGTDGTLPGNYQSTFDEKVNFDGTNFFFTGTRATGVYGAPVPLNFGNITHLGNDAPRPGSDLLADLMNPYALAGTRLDISALDLAILADTGVSIDSVRNDFNNDQKADILWRNNDGRVALWQMNGSIVSIDSIFDTVANDWKIAGTGDFNGDRKSDILWHNNDGRVTLWTMNGATKVTDTPIAKVSTDLKIAGTGDFNGDDKSDLLWRNDDGTVVLWQMDGATQLAANTIAKISTDWKIAGTGDFNGDDKSDLLWRNEDGTVALWQMDGANVLSESYLNPNSKVDNSWKISGLGDFNADSKSDILWRNDNGDVDIWLMDGSNVRTASSVGSVDNSWKISGTSDFSGDGQDDILWRKDNGSTSLWEMNGTNILAASAINPNPLISTDWKVAAPIL